MGFKGDISGNLYVSMTFDSNQICISDMEKMLYFIESHENIYLYGKGKCGTGFMEYAQTCHFDNVKGFITSEKLDSFFENYSESRDGVILTITSQYYTEVLPLIWDRIREKDILFLREETKSIFIKSFSREYLEENMWITLPVSKHCNVNCASCNMFSPICKPECYRLDEVKRDIEKLKSIDTKLSKINITGGEPFLNTELIEIVKVLRSVYRDTKIDLYTNGVLMKRLSDEEFEILKKCDINLRITEYPGLQTSLDHVVEKLDSMDIDYELNHLEEGKSFYKKTIDFEKGVPVYEFINCQYYTYCFGILMFNGILYKCPLAMNYQEINEYFGKKIESSTKDSLALAQVDNPGQIHDYWRSRLPLCDYCPRVTEAFEWKKSERKIGEWT